MTDRYADADPEETVTVKGVGHMTLRRAVHKYDDWREHHGLSLVLVYRDAGKEPSFFDMADLSRLAEMERLSEPAIASRGDPPGAERLAHRPRAAVHEE